MRVNAEPGKAVQQAAADIRKNPKMTSLLPLTVDESLESEDNFFDEAQKSYEYLEQLKKEVTGQQCFVTGIVG